MISKKSIRVRLRQRMAQHPSTYAHEHFAAVANEVGQCTDIVRVCMLEGVVMTAYAIHRQRMMANEPRPTLVLDDDTFIATQVQRLASFGVTPEIAQMAVEQFPHE